MSATSILINVGAATAGAVSELAKVDHALEGNESAAKDAAAVMKTQMARQSAAMESAGDASKRAAADVDSSMSKMGDGADTVASKGSQAAGALAGLGDLIGGPFGGAMQTAGIGMQAAADAGDLLNVAVEGGKKAFDAAKAAIAQSTVATHLQAAATKIAAAGQAVFNAVMAANPIVLVVLAIVALIAIVVLLWKNWDTVTKALGKAWDWMKAKALAVFGALKTWLANVWNSIRDTAVNAFNALKTKVAAIWGGIKTAVSTAIAALVTFVTGMPGKILSAIGNLGSLLFEKGKDLVQGLIDGIIKMDLAGFVAGLPGKILSAIGSLSSLLYQKGRDLIQGLINGIKSLLGGIGNLIKNALPDIPGIGSPFSATAVTPSAAAFMAGPTPTTTPAPAAREATVIVTEEQVARAIQRLLMKSDARNGRLVMVG